MSSRPTRKRTTTQRFNFAGNVKSEPRDEEEEGEEEEGGRSGRRQRPRVAEAVEAATSSSSKAQRGKTRGRSSVTRAVVNDNNDDDDDDDDVNDGGGGGGGRGAHVRNNGQQSDPNEINPYLQVMKDERGKMKIHDIELTTRQVELWDRLPDDVKAQLVKAVTRLLLMKGMCSIATGAMVPH
jgi:hypothetical protein